MKLILVRTFFFIGFFLVYCVANFFFNTKLVVPYLSKIDPNPGVYFIGDSHMRYAVNPKIFSNAVNLGQDAEPLYVTYWKLRALEGLDSNDVVALGFSHSSLSARNEMKLNNSEWGETFYVRLASILSYQDIKHVQFSKKLYIKSRFKHLCLFPNFSKPKWIDEFAWKEGKEVSLKSPNQLRAEIIFTQHYFLDNEYCGVSTFLGNYIDSIQNFCKTRKVNFVLLEMPVHNSYKNLIDDNYKIANDSILRRFPSLSIQVVDSSLYLNADHLNRKGAEYYSKKLKKSLLTKDYEL